VITEKFINQKWSKKTMKKKNSKLKTQNPKPQYTPYLTLTQKRFFPIREKMGLAALSLSQITNTTKGLNSFSSRCTQDRN
jgi:hypothetical protein